MSRGEGSPRLLLLASSQRRRAPAYSSGVPLFLSILTANLTCPIMGRYGKCRLAGLPRWPQAVGAENGLSAGATVTAVLAVINPTPLSCPYAARVLAGTHH